jgi:hypothetical protein
VVIANHLIDTNDFRMDLFLHLYLTIDSLLIFNLNPNSDESEQYCIDCEFFVLVFGMYSIENTWAEADVYLR